MGILSENQNKPRKQVKEKTSLENQIGKRGRGGIREKGLSLCAYSLRRLQRERERERKKEGKEILWENNKNEFVMQQKMFHNIFD